MPRLCAITAGSWCTNSDRTTGRAAQPKATGYNLRSTGVLSKQHNICQYPRAKHGERKRKKTRPSYYLLYAAHFYLLPCFSFIDILLNPTLP
jgi:hypothetical protein